MSKWDEIFGRGFKGARGGGAGAPSAGDGASVVRQVARTTFRLFKNNCFVLPWIREREELDASINGARADLLRSWNVYQSGLKSRRGAARAEADWRRVQSDFRRHIADLNRRIAAYNLRAPSAAFRKSPLDPDGELRKTMNCE
jgi:hypothetical protein